MASPRILRQINGQRGLSHTVVFNENGTQDAYDSETVAALASQSQNELEFLLGSLTDSQLHGLVREMSQQLLLNSRLYQQQMAEWEELQKDDHFSYFGLSKDATEKELNNAYRKLAKEMHPDKNKGTEEATQKFQDMKMRYEQIRKTGIRSDQPKAGIDPRVQPTPQFSKQPQARISIKYDPSSRDSLMHSANDMLQRLKVLNSSTSAL